MSELGRPGRDDRAEQVAPTELPDGRRPDLSDCYVDDEWDIFDGRNATNRADEGEPQAGGLTDGRHLTGGPDKPAAEARDRAVSRVGERLDITDPAAIDALGRAYDVARHYTAPVVVKATAEMLSDLQPLTAANPDRRVVFVGRDGHSLALAARVLEPDWFDRSATEAVLSRAVVEAAVQDMERNAGKTFPQLDAFRGAASKVEPEDVPGARERLAEYLQTHGVPVSEPGSEVTLVDSSYKGTVQELLAAVFPATEFDGRYLFHAQAPGDPHAGSKKGYVLHLDAERGNGGLPLSDLPADPDLVFAHQDTIGVFEETLHGPWSSPRRIGGDGPEQEREAPSLRGISPVRVAGDFADPITREGVLDISLHAVVDCARHVAALRNAGQEWRPDLDQAAGRFRDEVRHWISGQPTDGDFAAVLDSFVRRADKTEVADLTAAINRSGLSADHSIGVWQNYHQLPTLDDKRAYVARFAAEHEEDRRPHG